MTVINIYGTNDGNDVLTGDSGENWISGYGGDDTLDGGARNDELHGGDGNDTFIFGRGYGNDVIFEYDAAGIYTDTVRIASGVLPTDVIVTRDKDSLYLSINNPDGTTDTLTLLDWFWGDSYRIDRVVFADDPATVWDVAKLTALISVPIGTYIADPAGSIIKSSISYTLDNNIQNLVLLGSADLSGTGNSLDNNLIGNTGNNRLDGGIGSDTMSGGLGNDLYIVDNVGDRVVENLYEGTDTVQSRISYTLGNNVENLTLVGSADINGTGNSLNNFLIGNNYNNILDGGAGYDTLRGGYGNDTYVFGRGYGQDEILDYVPIGISFDTVRFKSGILPEDVIVTRDQSDMCFSINNPDGTTDTLTVKFWFSDDTYKIERVVFTDDPATVWDVDALWGLVNTPTENADHIVGTNRADIINGLGGNDTIIGNGGDDILDGGTGNDFLQGDSGNDTYLFNRGSGQDTILDFDDITTANVDTLRFGAGITVSDILFSRNGSNLVLGIKGTSDQVTIQGWGYGNNWRIERVEFADGVVWDAAQLQTMVPSDPLVGTEGDDELRSWDNANDILDGGAGNDTLIGGSGSDVYLFKLGGGQDTIVDESDYTAGDVDTLRFGPGITASDISFKWSKGVKFDFSGSPFNTIDLVLSINGTSDQVTISDCYANWPTRDTRIERVEFADGTVWDAAQLQALALAGPYVGTDAGEVLEAWADGNVTLQGLGGNDYLKGSNGNDTLDGGSGSDEMYGWAGNDTYIVDNAGDSVVENLNEGNDTVQSSISYTLGNNLENLTLLGTAAINGTGNNLDNTLIGNSGNNILDGGTGNDSLQGGAGNDTYLFGRGYGQDTIIDYDTTGGNIDTVRIASGVLPSDVIFSRDSFDLYLSINNPDGSIDKLTIKNWFKQNANKIEQVVFADDPATVWSAAALTSATNTSMINQLLPGQAVQGQINSGDIGDWYQVSLTAGQTYTFAMIGTGVNNLRDPYLTLRDSAGNSIAVDDNSGPSYGSDIQFTAPTSGTYIIEAKAHLASESGQYGLSFTQGAVAHYDVAMGAGALDSNLSWSNTPGTGATVTYGFRQSAPGYGTFGHSSQSTFSQLTVAEMNAIRTCLSEWSDACNIQFTEVNPGGYTDNATLLFSNYYDTSDGAQSFAYYPGATASTSAAGDVYLNTAHVSTSSVPLGSYDYMAILHEIGHALGLSHPGDYNATPGVSITYSNSAQFIEDSGQYTLMSYFDASNTGAYLGGKTLSFNPVYNYTPMLLDAYAMQQIYGVNYSTRATDTVYGFGCTAGSIYDFSQYISPALCIWDGGGIDLLDASGYNLNQTLNLNEGAFSTIGMAPAYSWGSPKNNVSIAIGAVIENATGGSGNDVLIGNDVANILSGGTGNDILDGGIGADTLDGGAGSDAMSGGLGNDTYIVDNIGDSVMENLGEGTDTVQSSIGYTLGSNVENLALLGTADLNGTGNELDNSLTGNAGANSLDGGAGNDLLNGGAGDDQYRFSLGGGNDQIIDSSGADRIVFGPGITDTQVTASRDNGEVVLTASDSSSIRFAELGVGNYAVEQFLFADGTIKDAFWIRTLLDAAPIGVNDTASARASNADSPLTTTSAAVSVYGNTVSKSGGTNGSWNDADAYSSAGLTGSATVSARAGQTDKYGMFGLNSDPTADSNFTSLDYAWFTSADGHLYIFESGVPKAHIGTYTTSDVLTVAYSGTTVSYLLNGVAVRTVGTVANQTFYVDSSFYTTGFTLNDVQFSSPAINPTGNVLTNDTDVDAGDSKTVIGVNFNAGAGTLDQATAGNFGSLILNAGASTLGQATAGNYGSLILNADGSYRYVVDNNNASVQALNTGSTPLSETFAYTMRDAAGLTSTATLTVSVRGVDDASVLVADTGSGLEDSIMTGNVLSNDSDVDDTLTVASFTVAGSSTAYSAGQTAILADIGSLTLNSNGTYSFTPTANWNGAVPKVTYTTNTGSIAILSINVTPVNDAPVAVNDSAGAISSNSNSHSLLTESVAVSIYGHSIRKSAGTNGSWNDAEAYSSVGFTGNAYVSARAGQTDKYGMFGLNSDPTADSNFTSLDYAWFTSADGHLYIFESGVPKAHIGAYTTADVLTVAYSGTTVSYLLNGVAVRTVSTAANQTLYVDSSFYTTGFTLNDVQFGAAPLTTTSAAVSVYGNTVSKTGGTSGSWNDADAYSSAGFTGSATVSARAGQTDKYGMFGLNSDPTTDSNFTSLDYAWFTSADGHLYIFESGVPKAHIGSYTTADVLTVAYNGTTVSYLLNGVAVRTVSTAANQTLYVDSSFYTTGFTLNDVQFGAAPLTTSSAAVSVYGNTVSKTGGTNGSWNDADAYSSVGFTGSATVSARAGQTDKYGMFGLNSDPATDSNFTSLDYAWFTSADGHLYIFESGVSKAHIGSYTTADVLTVAYSGTTVSYLLNGVAVRTVSTAANQTFYVDSSFYTTGFTLNDVQFSSPAVNTTGNVLTNDTDVDAGDSKTVIGVSFNAAPGALSQATAGNYGSLILNADGSYRYVVDSNNAQVKALNTGSAPLSETFAYTMRDAAGLTSTATLTVSVRGVDDASVLVADTGSGLEDNMVTGNVLSNDSDVDDTLTVASFTVAGGSSPYSAGQTATLAGIGSLTLNSNGAYSFTPTANWNGAVPKVTYTTNTGSIAILNINVTPVNDAPVAVNDSAAAISSNSNSNSHSLLTESVAVSIYGHSVKKSAGTNGSWNDADAYSSAGFTGNAYVSARAGQTDKYGMFGLNSDPTADSNFTSLDYAWFTSADGHLYIFESGVSKAHIGAYTTADVLTVAYSGTTVSYLLNGVAVRTVSTVANQTLYVDSSFYTTGFTLNDVQFGAAPLTTTSAAVSVYGNTVSKTGGTNGSWNDADAYSSAGLTGSATVSARAGQTDKYGMFGLNSDPTTDSNFTSLDYAWFTSADGHLYIFESGVPKAHIGAYTTADVLTVAYNGTTVSYLLNGVAVRTVSTAANQTLYVDSSFYTTGFILNDVQFGAAPLTTTSAAVSVYGNTVSKTGGTNGSWNDADAYSSVGFTGSATASARAGQTDKYGMFGLNSDPATDSNFTSLDYAWFTSADGHLYIFESGVSKAHIGAYTTSDVLTVAYNGTTVSYLLNGVAVRRVSTAANQTFYVDSSFYTTGFTLNDVQFSSPAINPTGNVLTNDTDVDAGDSKTVIGVSFNAASGTLGQATAGKYGSLILNSDGSYHYVVDNNNAHVQALNAGSTPLSETFAYTMRDSLGLTSTATLTVSVKGVNNVSIGNSTASIGNDSYLLKRGYGSGTIQENDATAGNIDVLNFGSDIASNQLWFRHVNNDLEVSVIGSTDKATLIDWYSGSAYHVEQFQAGDGKLLTDANVDALVQAMAAFAPPSAGQPLLPQDYQTALAPVLAANWQ